MKLRYAGLTFVFIWFALGGVGHFVLTDLFLRIVPSYIPWPKLAVYVSGVFELLGAVAICLPRFRRVAGLGLIALTICVTPANIYMWMHPAMFPTIPAWLLSFRLIFQLIFIWIIWWSTRRQEPG